MSKDWAETNSNYALLCRIMIDHYICLVGYVDRMPESVIVLEMELNVFNNANHENTKLCTSSVYCDFITLFVQNASFLHKYPHYRDGSFFQDIGSS